MNIASYAILIIYTVSIAGCAESKVQAPSSNASLNAVSPNSTQKKKKYYMQQHYDSWVKKEWEPATEEKTSAATAPKIDTQTDITSKTPHQDKNSADGTLQKYVDKWDRYLEKTEKEEKPAPSHVDQLEQMPAIGR